LSGWDRLSPPLPGVEGGQCKGSGRACDDFCHWDLAVSERLDELTAWSPQRAAPSW
jgi:hypothetical protein